jgi:small multidrug resistance pump
LQTISVGIAYAVWSGLGVILITFIAWIIYGQHLDPPALIGMLLIISGIVVMNLFSKAVSH